MNPASARISRPGFRDSLHHDAGLRNAKTRPAICFRHGNAEPAIRRNILYEFFWKLTIGIPLQPIVSAVFLAFPVDGITNCHLFLGPPQIDHYSLHIS